MFLLLWQITVALPEFIQQSREINGENNLIETVAENSANYVDTKDLLKKLPDGVKIAEEDGMIILYGVLFNNGSIPDIGEASEAGGEVTELSDKIISIIKEKTELNDNIAVESEELVWEEVKDPGSLILQLEDEETPQQSNDIIFGKPKYDILPSEPPKQEDKNSYYQNLPQLDQHLFNLSTSFSFSEPPPKLDAQEEKLKQALTARSEAFGSNNPLYAEPITHAIPAVQKEDKKYHKVPQGHSLPSAKNTKPPVTHLKPAIGHIKHVKTHLKAAITHPKPAETYLKPAEPHKKPAVTLIYPEETFITQATNKIYHSQPVTKPPAQRQTYGNYGDLRRGNAEHKEEIVSNTIEEVVEEPYLETDHWQIYWDDYYGTWYYFDKKSGISTWTKPKDLMHIHLKDQTQGETRRPKMKDEIAANNELKYSPIPSSPISNQKIPLHNPSKDFYLFTNNPKSQAETPKIPDRLPLPPNPPPHLIKRGHRRVDVVEEPLDIPRPPGLPMKYNMPPFIQLVGKEQSPLGYQREFIINPDSGARYHGYFNRDITNRRLDNAKAHEEKGKTTSSIVNKVWKNTIGNLFGGRDKDEDKKLSRAERRRKEKKKERRPTPILDMIVKVASKSAVKYFEDTFLKGESKSDKDKEKKESKDEQGQDNVDTEENEEDTKESTV